MGDPIRTNDGRVLLVATSSYENSEAIRVRRATSADIEYAATVSAMRERDEVCQMLTDMRCQRNTRRAERDDALAEVERLRRELDAMNANFATQFAARKALELERDCWEETAAAEAEGCSNNLRDALRFKAERDKALSYLRASNRTCERELQRVVRALDTPAQPEPDYSDCEHYSDCTAWPGAICPTSCDGCDGEYPPRDDAAQPEPQEERRCGTCRDWCGHYCKHPFTKTTPETESDGTTCPDWTRKEVDRG